MHVLITQLKLFSCHACNALSPQTLYHLDDDGTPGEEQVLDELSPLHNAAIRLSAPLFQTLNWNNSTSVGVVLGIYQRDNLFLVSGRENDASTTRQTQVCSSVLSATVGRNMAFDNLTQEELVTVLFRVQQKNDNNMVTDSLWFLLEIFC